jgi:hypothetical protein
MSGSKVYFQEDKHFAGHVARDTSCHERKDGFVKMADHGTYTLSHSAAQDIPRVKCLKCRNSWRTGSTKKKYREINSHP